MGALQLKKVLTILTSVLFFFSLQIQVLATDQEAESSTFELSGTMKDTLAIVIIAIVFLASWILAHKYSNRRHNPTEVDASIIRTEEASKDEEPNDAPMVKVSSKTATPAPRVEKSNPIVPVETKRELEEHAVDTTLDTQTTHTAPKVNNRLNIFTIIAFILLIVGAFFKGSNKAENE